MVRTFVSFAALVGVSLVSANAQALFIFGSRKFEMRCMLSNEHPGAGKLGKDLPAAIVTAQGSAKTSGVIDLVSNRKVLIRGVRADIGLTQANSGVFTLAVRFLKPDGKVLHQERTTLRPAHWSAVKYEGWPKDMSYLAARCMIQRAR